jgi:hypothetical protein
VIICFRSRLGYEIEWSFLCRVVEQVKKGGCCERSRDGDTVYAVGPRLEAVQGEPTRYLLGKLGDRTVKEQNGSQGETWSGP